MADPPPPPGLARRRGLARLALVWEAAWPLLWAPLAVLGGFLVLALLGVPQRLPPALHALLLAGVALLIAGLSLRAWRRFALPGAPDAERRLERDSGLAHRPLATLADRATGSDPASLALWRAHQARAAAALGRLRVTAPHPQLARRDPRALRAALVLGLGAALVMAGAEAPERLRRALLPSFAAAAPPLPPRLEAWATPPAYTGAAPIFLSAGGGEASLPAGSRLQVVVSGGGEDAPELVGAAPLPLPFRALEAGSFAAETTVGADARLAVRRAGREVASWSLAVRPDAPPVAAFTEPPGRAPRGTGLRLPWRAEDDWGLAALVAEAALAVRPDAPPLAIELGLPGGGPKSARGVGQPDLTAHPWAGLEVRLRLRARDGAGQEGVSAAAALTLPERSFNHPVAQRLVAIRRDLSRDPTARGAARGALDGVLARPEAFEHDTTTYLTLRVARARLGDRRDEAVPEVQALLWEVALALEEGRDGRTARALQQAAERLRESLERAEQAPAETPERQAAREDAERRVTELRDAVRQHLEALAERLQRENAEAIPFDPSNRMLDPRELDRRTQRMREATRGDRAEEARRELAELEEMLRALEEGRAQRAEPPERRQRRERGQQQQGVVQDMVRRQGEMLDRSHQRAEEADRDRAARSRPRPPFGSPPPLAPTAEAERERGQDGRRQRALRRALGEVMQQFGDLTGEVPEALGRADQAMRDAQERLGAGGDARDAQARAMRALQEGGRQMAQSMQRALGPPQGGEGEEEGEGEGDQMLGEGPGGGEGDQPGTLGEGRDPLGRRTREVGGTPDSGADTRVPDEAEQLRTRAIQEELRRRGAEKARPAEELDYIDRLLKRF